MFYPVNHMICMLSGVVRKCRSKGYLKIINTLQNMSEGRFSWVCGENISRKEVSVTGAQKAKCGASAMTS